ncbi:aldo/keto reductase [Propionicicella superfundia]|uniref:aldo/keto reductase n=1 Tax=Propionicicella superfundia TaxID=348582 RepID=UPI00042A2CAF|nr:aldo/keto reductase [Propionicicella superfundia]
MQRITMADGLETSRVALGFWRWAQWGISVDELERLVDGALELGITLFDHANIYDHGNPEAAFGEVLARRPGLRESVQIITKSTIVYPSASVRVKYYDTSRAHIVSELEASLRRLRTDYVDLLLLHRPDPHMNPEETAAAFSQLHEQGKVRFFGVSNYKAHHYEMLAGYCDQPLITNEIEASVLQHENFDDGTVAHCQQRRIHPIAWSPLAGGRVFTGTDDAAVRVRAELETVRAEIGAPTIDEVALAWLLSHPVGFLTITGAEDLGFVRRPVDALRHRLTDEQWFAIWSACTGHKVL